MTDEASQNHSSVPTATHARRTVLAGVGIAGIATALTACGSGSGSAGSGAAAGPASTPAAAAPSAPASSADAGGGGGTALGETSEVPVGGGKVFAAQKVVVTQPTAAGSSRRSAVCTHMGCTVGSVSGGTINCPCHGSQYHIADGSVAHGPAPSALASETIVVANGAITLSS